jgi:hypothetical protein
MTLPNTVPAGAGPSCAPRLGKAVDDGLRRAHAAPHMWRMGSMVTRISHCDEAFALLDGAARVSIQSWIPDVPRSVRGVRAVLEGALAHGRTKEKNLPVTPGHAPQPSGAAARSAFRVRQLRRAEAAAPRVQPLRPLRWTRGRCCRQGAAGRCKGLRPGIGVRLVNP